MKLTLPNAFAAQGEAVSEATVYATHAQPLAPSLIVRRRMLAARKRRGIGGAGGGWTV